MTIIINATSETGLSAVNVLRDNVFTYADSVTWTSQTSGYEALNLTEETTWNSWKPNAVPSNVAAFIDDGRTCNCAGIAAHNMASVGASFQIQYQLVAGGPWASAIPDTSPVDDSDILCFFDSVTAYGWRIRVLGAAPNIGCVFIGSKISFPCAPLTGHRPLHHAREYVGLINQSMTGQLLGTRVVQQGAATSVDVGLIDRDFAEGALAPFERHYNRGKAFFYCGSPLDTPADMGYCWKPASAAPMSITWEEGDGMAAVSLELEAYVNA